MKMSKMMADSLLTIDDESIGAAFKAALATRTESKSADELFQKCAKLSNDSFLCLTILLETIFKEEDGEYV